MKKFLSVLLCATMIASPFSGLAVTANAEESGGEITASTTYSNNGYTFEKVSHYNAGTEEGDGIVDYTSPLQITANTDGNNDSADTVQSYTYCAVSYGDWVYMGTMYGALSAYTQVESAVQKYGVSEDVAKAVVDTMFNGKLNKGKESDGYPAGSVFFKFNVKTGETKILMSRTLYNQGKCDGVPIFRSACEYNGKLYFVGLVSDGKALAGQSIYGTAVPDNPAIAINYEINMQSGIPCVYEVDPENNDELVKVTQCVTKDGYIALNNRYAFTSTRAINTFTATMEDGSTQEWLLAGGLSDTTKGETYGATIMAAYQPSAVTADYEETDLDVLHGDFETIADQNDLYNYPAITRTDASGGGGLYQIVQYGENTIYTAIVSGKKADGTKEQCYAIVKGVYDPSKGEVSDKDAWTWTPVVGNQDKDGATYTFGIDPTRTAANACTLQVYDGYLYIGEYNDVNYSLTNILTDKSFKILSKNLSQSINLYRMDEDENVELVVGDTTEMFPENLTGIGSGYESHMNQYTWMTSVVGDTMYLSTMDETSLTHVLAQFKNGELLDMSEEEWESQLNYLLTLVELLMPAEDENSALALEESDQQMTEEEALALVEKAVAAANQSVSSSDASILSIEDEDNADYQFELTDEQKQELVQQLMSGAIEPASLDDATSEVLGYLNKEIRIIASMMQENVSQKFIELYQKILDDIQAYVDNNENIDANVKGMYDLLFTFASAENLGYLSNCLSYMEDSVAGFDLYAIYQDEDGDVSVTTVSNNGFGDRYNHGLRVFATTDDYLAVGTANPFYGAQIWRMSMEGRAIDVSRCDVEEIPDQTYTGSEVEPAVTVKYGDTTLKNGRDYTVTYSDNIEVGTATATITCKGNYSGTTTVDFDIYAAEDAEAVITVEDQTYTGEEIESPVTVEVYGKTLTEGTDYTVTYEDNVNAGPAKAIVTFEGYYSTMPAATQEFTINPIELTDDDVTLDWTSALYDGEEKTVTPEVTSGDAVLVADEDYTVDGATGLYAGTYTAIIEGIRNYAGTIEKEYYIDGLVSDKAVAGGWYYLVNGEKDETYTGFASNKYGDWYVENGEVTFLKNDVIKDTDGVLGIEGAWYYVAGSKVQYVDTVAKNAYGWWKISCGIVDFDYTGFASNANGDWYVENGKVTFQKNGVIKDTTGALGEAGAWYYVSNSKVQRCNTVAKNANGWWKITNGKVDFKYTGIATNEYGTWYCQNGKVNFNYSGKVKYNGKTYKVKNGKVAISFMG